MALTNSAQRYGGVAKTFHWLTALLIFSAIGLGLIASDLPYDTSAALAYKAQLFSLHKTIGVTLFCTALVRILWALSQPKPPLLNPTPRAQALLAETVHWLLYASLLLVPLTGWIEHAASSGFAPIWGPFGQSLPFVPKSEAVAASFAALHWLFGKLLIATILLHIAGALKHHFIDRDDTLRRMLPGASVRQIAAPQKTAALPILAATAIYAIIAGTALAMVSSPDSTDTPTAVQSNPTSGWQVQSGALTFNVNQLGSAVEGGFATWSANITFDEASTTGILGNTEVTIDMASVTLGAVTDQAKTADFLDTTAHPTAIFKADITAADTGYIADGTLTLHGMEAPLALPFTLTIDGDIATMQGQLQLDRRAFGIGPAYPDEATVGFMVTVNVTLTAQRG